MSKVCAAHQEGQQNAGIDVTHGCVFDAVQANIYDLYNGKKSAYKLAADAAMTILKVDQVRFII